MSVLETAENKSDEKLLRRIRGFDFFACEASFHSSCYRRYQRSPTHWGSANEENERGQDDFEESHRTASTKVCDVTGKKIIQGQRIMKLSDLCEMYVSALEKTTHSKPDYKAGKLKKKWEKSGTKGQKLPFCSLNSEGKCKSHIVYNSDVSTDRCVTLAYELGSTDIVQHVALYLRNMISEAF